jgi:DNA-binding NarL/FixJ family response regulator
VTCIVDRKGYVYSSGAGYDQLSQIEWPNCTTSSGISDNLLKLLNVSSDAVYQGKQVIFFLKVIGDLIYIVAQKCRRDIRLTCREREICQGLTAGKSYENVAAQLGITHSTVTTHANNIYRKLGVTDKLSLARLLCP